MISKLLLVFLKCALLALSVSSVLAAESAPVPPGKSISEFVSPDGRINLDAVRKSGYQGPLDLKGLNVRIDSKTGEPLVQSAPKSASASDPYDIYWDNSISPSIASVDLFVLAVTVYDNKLIAGGGFTVIGGVSANYIASWDGSSWSALGTGMNSAVYAFTFYNNRLIAGGGFTMAGGAPASRIASWNNFSWSGVGSGLTGGGSVSALTVYNNKLIAGGSFTTLTGGPSNYIAAWDGFSWLALGTGTNAFVQALTVYDNKLIAGGSFDSAGGVAANRIASWDGSSWLALGTGIGGTNPFPTSLTVYDNKLIAGGNFTMAGGKESAYLARWTKCCDGVRGDVNDDGTDANILDLTFLVDRIFRSGPPAICTEEADVNSDGTSSNILDLTFLVDRIFRGGLAPGACY